MTPLPIVVALIIVVRLFARAYQVKTGKARPIVWPDPRRTFWAVVAAVLLVAGLPLGIGLTFALIERFSIVRAALLLAYVAVVAAIVALYLSSWWLLHRLARRGRHRLVYYATQLTPLFVMSGDTRGGGLLLSALALAYRPSCTADHRAFVERRLARERRGGAAFGAALGLWHALEARAARDSGDTARAFDLAERAWAIFGTVTYMSPQAAPLPVRRVAEEFLALDSARRAHWGGIETLSKSWHAREVTPAARALLGYLEEKLKGRPPSPDEARQRAKLASPIVDRLFEREPRKGHVSVAEATAHAARAYVALRRREPVSPRLALAMLATYDHLLHPASPDTVLPPEVRDDGALVEAVHDDVAAALVEVLAPVGVPLVVLRAGPISARVHARLETMFLQDLARALKRLDDRRTEGTRLDARSEWLDVSLVRATYRRLQFTLGDAAAARVQQTLAYSYGNLGVDMTAKPPIRRPLAHAIFNMLHGEAVRFGHRPHIALQTKNMSVTAGPL